MYSTQQTTKTKQKIKKKTTRNETKNKRRSGEKISIFVISISLHFVAQHDYYISTFILFYLAKTPFEKPQPYLFLVLIVAKNRINEKKEIYI